MAATLGTLDALARLQLAARRLGGEIRLVGPSPELRELIDLAGLGTVLPVEPGGETEQREERLGVEEERELGDPPS
jgi:anti-anti-sigma regulatory factor